MMLFRLNAVTTARSKSSENHIVSRDGCYLRDGDTERSFMRLTRPQLGRAAIGDILVVHCPFTGRRAIPSVGSGLACVSV